MSDPSEKKAMDITLDVVRKNWERFRPHARELLTKDTTARYLVMLVHSQMSAVAAYGQSDLAECQMLVDRAQLAVRWDAVAQPYKSRGVRGCLVIWNDHVLDRFDWGPRQ